MDQLNIYIDRLKDDEVEQIDEKIDATTFDIQEKELQLEGQVKIEGSAYLTKEHLVLDLKIHSKITLPCTVCNQTFSLPIQIETFILTVAVEEIQGAIYNLRDEIRNAIFLKIPPFSECHDGECPSRKELSKFFKQGDNLPFSELTL